MASMNIKRNWECASQNHVTLDITGDITYTFHGDMADLTASVTEEEKRAFVKLLIRFAKIGRTNAQVRTALTNGVTVTI